MAIILRNGDVVLVTFPFTDLSSSKLRPAVIISTEVVHKNEDDFTLLFISSVIPQNIEAYELLFSKKHPDFLKSGLKKDSLFKTNKIATIQSKLIRRKLGSLGPKIRGELQTMISLAISL